MDELPDGAPTLITAPLAGPSVASLPMDTAIWCSIDPAEVATARAELQAGIFNRSLPGKRSAPELPKYPRRPETVVNAEEHTRRQAEFERAHAAVKQARAEHAEHMAAREKQLAADLHRLRQHCLQVNSAIDLERRQEELEAVFPSKSFFNVRVQAPEDLADLHLKYCCPPIDSPLWTRSSCGRTPGWTHTRPPSMHIAVGDPTAHCDRRRKLLGVARLAPHESAERWNACPLPGTDSGWRDWTLLQIHRRTHGVPAPVLTCSRERCSCEAVMNAPPLKLQLPFKLGGQWTNVQVEDYWRELVDEMQQKAENLEAQGVPVDREHLQQLLSKFRDQAHTSDALFACGYTQLSSYPFCDFRASCLHCQVRRLEHCFLSTVHLSPAASHQHASPIINVGECQLRL